MTTILALALWLALCAGAYVVGISALALALYVIDPRRGAPQPEPMDLRVARLRGIT